MSPAGVHFLTLEEVQKVPKQKEALRCNLAAEAGLAEPSDRIHELSWRQRQILQVIRESVERRGYPPSMREIAEAVGLSSKSSVAYHLSALQEQGYLHRDAGRPRTVEMREPRHSSESGLDSADGPVGPSSLEGVCIPWVGQIAAGNPTIAREAGEGTFLLPRQLVGGGDFFVLSIVGDSMINVGMFDGDWVVVRRQSVAENGDIVAALIGREAEATVKAYVEADGHVWLMPHNPIHTPISGDDAEIIGKVVTLFRRM